MTTKLWLVSTALLLTTVSALANVQYEERPISQIPLDSEIQFDQSLFIFARTESIRFYQNSSNIQCSIHFDPNQIRGFDRNITAGTTFLFERATHEYDFRKRVYFGKVEAKYKGEIFYFQCHKVDLEKRIYVNMQNMTLADFRNAISGTATITLSETQKFEAKKPEVRNSNETF